MTEEIDMTTNTCRIQGCGITFCRPPEVPIPHDICTRCWEEMNALRDAHEQRQSRVSMFHRAFNWLTGKRRGA